MLLHRGNFHFKNSTSHLRVSVFKHEIGQSYVWISLKNNLENVLNCDCEEKMDYMIMWQNELLTIFSSHIITNGQDFFCVKPLTRQLVRFHKGWTFFNIMLHSDSIKLFFMIQKPPLIAKPNISLHTIWNKCQRFHTQNQCNNSIWSVDKTFILKTLNLYKWKLICCQRHPHITRLMILVVTF